MSKVIVFGIDGGSLKLIEQWKDQLPNFKQIMQDGVFGELESTIPALTCPAWPCMFTGENPGKLGMYEFLNLQLTEGHGFRPFSSSDYHSASLWKILSDYDKKVGLLNVPMTYPPHKINGFMVCGIGTPQPANSNYTYPPQLEETLNEVAGGYMIVPPVTLTVHGKEEQYLKVFNETLDKRVKAARYLMSNFPWDLFICVFFVSDGVQHYFWHHMDTNHPRYINNSKHKDAIKEFYKRIDGAIGTLISETPEDTNILMVSDHGFGPYYGSFSVNKWLEENGFLRFQTRVHQKRIDAGLRRVRDLLLPRLNLKLARLVARVIPQELAKKLSTMGEVKDRMLEMVRSIDWAETKAYGLGVTGGIFINLKGKQPGGIVEPGREYEDIRDEIIKKLSEVVNSETGEPVASQIFKREDIYHGQYAHLAPDISIVADKYYPIAVGSVAEESQWCRLTTAASGSHARAGVFMACGPDIKKGEAKLANLKIYDITPTILHIFGLPVPEDMDGRVLTEIFKPGSEPARRTVVYKEVSERERIKSRISQLKASGKI